MVADRIRVVFVCTGNICRSPMADVMLRAALTEGGLAERVTVSSVGTGGWHVGGPMDPRAAVELTSHGYDPTHVAAQLSTEDHSADLIVALDRGHRAHLHEAGVEPDRVRLLCSFDPDTSGEDVADPYYGDHTDFATTHREIAAALPGLLAKVRDLLG